MRFASTGLFSWIEKGATIVTPSRLSAAAAVEMFARHKLAQKVESWKRPKIYSVEGWLSACWQQARYHGAGVPALLSPAQERLLWQRIIEQEHPDLFDISSTAQLARQAARLIAEWCIPLDSELWSGQEDAQQFQKWLKHFRRTCREEGWIVRADLWRLLPRWLAEGTCSRELTVLAGFARFTPALEEVKRVLGDSAVVEHLRDRPIQRAPAKLCVEFSQEIEEAARWARALFEQNSGKSTAIFVPDLATHRALVERTFQQVFYPSAVLRFETNADSAFHVNAAAPLERHPLAASALLLLELSRRRIQIADAGAILRCPFLAGAEAERSERAMADLELRRKRELDVSLQDIEFASGRCRQMVRICQSVRRLVRQKMDQREFAAWSDLFSALLTAAGWPGDRLTDNQQEIAEDIKERLADLSALGLVSGPVPFDIALVHLRHLLSTPGPERGDWSSPVQILDSSEAAGLEFDHACVTGLSDETWPSTPEIYPLVPLKLQRAYHVPDSSPQSVQQERERLTQSLFSTAPVTVATYSGRLSPIAARFLSQEHIDLSQWQGKLPRQSFTPTVLEEPEDTKAPPYLQNEGTRGGVSLIRSQSLCAFRAFAEFRLAARTPEEGCFGFDSRERGGFLHSALQNVWNRIKTQRQLLSLSSVDLANTIRDAVEEALEREEPGPFHEALRRAECERLEQVIHDWLDIERGRKQPFSVETIEGDQYYDLPGLRIRLRVDRMDRLANGKLVLIDYKSGPQTRGKLKCPRPPEPQLLVYASAVGNEVEGIFFGEVKAREPRAVGFSRERQFAGNAAEVKKDWSAFLAEAKTEVQRLAAEFVEGYAAVDPIKGACEFCSLSPLCRIHERSGKAQEEE